MTGPGMNLSDHSKRRRKQHRQDDGQLTLSFGEMGSERPRPKPPTNETTSPNCCDADDDGKTQRDDREEDEGQSAEAEVVAIEFRPVEPVALTSSEAIKYLRLDVGKTPAAAQASLNRLVEKGLRPCMFKKERLFERREIDRFLRERTDRYRT